MPPSPSRARSTLRIVGVSALVAGVVTAVASAALTVAIARRVVTPPRKRDDDIRVLQVFDDRVTLSSTADSRTPGKYGLWFGGSSGHARIGAILAHDERTVTRELLTVDFGHLARGARARFNGGFYLRPKELGFPYQDVTIEMENGPSPAWLIPAAAETGKWVIEVHGRAVTRSEGLRAVPVFRDAGFSSLLISYRNDGEGAGSRDGRYALGDTEWRDVESAIDFAVSGGATDVVLMGWSMGGAMVLQAAVHSRHRDIIRGVVLESPVVDWVSVLDFQGAALYIPTFIRRAVLALIGGPASRRLTGQAQGIDLARLNFVRRAEELGVPVLLFHSDEDGYVPAPASRALAAARADIVTFEEFLVGRHVKLWNIDPDRWNGAIANWLVTISFTAATGRKARSNRRPEVGQE